MLIEWDERAADEIVAIAEQHRRRSADAAHVYATMAQMAAAEDFATLHCSRRRTWQMCWWSHGSVRAYFGSDERVMRVVHVAGIDAASSFAEAERRCREYFA